MSYAVEFVTFKLKKSVSMEDFLPISDKFNLEFLKKQPGYISRKLLIQDDILADLVLWNQASDHLNAMDKSKEDPVAREYFSMLNLSAKGSSYRLMTQVKAYDEG